MNLSIIIPTHNRTKSLTQLLDCIRQQIFTSNINLSIVIVVDEQDDCNTMYYKKKYPDFSVIQGSGEWWFTKSLNVGCYFAVEKLNAELLLTLNDDVIIPDDYIEKLLCAYNSLGKDAVIGSLSIDSHDRSSITFSGFKTFCKVKGSNIPYLPYRTTYNAKEHYGMHKSLTLPTRGLLFSKTIYNLVDGFDEIFPQYASDNDFVFKASKKGKDVYISYDAIVYEKTTLTGGGSPKVTNDFSFFLKNMFYNKYSPVYFKNIVLMNWRHKPKLLFPYYSLISIIASIKSFFKYTN